MKIALSTDWILERDHAIEMLDMLAELYREADLYTIAHAPNAVLGPIEERRIMSTFLSNKVKKPSEIFKWTFALPSTLRGLFIPCSVDAIVNISRGLSHGIKKCDKTPLFTYVYDLFWLSHKPQGFKQKLFWGQAKSFALKEFKKAHRIWVANILIQRELEQHGITCEVLDPFFKVEEFPLFPANLFKREVVLVEPGELTDHELEQLLISLEGQKVRILGDARTGFEPKLFLGSPCAGELAPMLASASVLIDCSTRSFPKNALAMLSCGGRVIALSESDQRIYLENDGTRFVAKPELFLTKLEDLLEDWNPDPKSLHNYVNRFHGTRFKRKIEVSIEGVGPKQTNC